MNHSFFLPQNPAVRDFRWLMKVLLIITLEGICVKLYLEVLLIQTFLHFNIYKTTPKKPFLSYKKIEVSKIYSASSDIDSRHAPRGI